MPASNDDTAGPLTTKDLSWAQAHKALHAAIEYAKSNNLKMNIAIVDAGTNLKAFARMDGSWIGSIDISQKKARTARYFDMSTKDLEPHVQPGKSLYHIEFSNGGLITFPGGVPIKDADGTVLGAIGVSGSTVEDDHATAMAGVKALG